MSGWGVVVDAAGLLALALILVAVYLIVRRRLLARKGGTFDLSVRVRSQKAGRGWVLGLGRYDADALEWFRVFSLSLRPAKTYKRRLLQVGSRRSPEGAEEFALYHDAVVVGCTYGQHLVELAMTEDALTGLLSWLEAAPPGRGLLSS
ncbi:MAG: DUF2550 domain-containing protein [Nocardioidaceae bacterium]